MFSAIIEKINQPGALPPEFYTLPGENEIDHSLFRA